MYKPRRNFYNSYSLCQSKIFRHVGSKRSSKIVFPRQIAMYLCREMLDAPLTGIGKMMGDRDHTTVMHGIEKIEKEMSAKDSVRNTVDILKKKINPSK